MFTPRTSVDRMQGREARARELFYEFDANGDGVIDLSELKQMLRSLELIGDGTKESVDREHKLMEEWNAMDVDHSGEVDFSEFIRYYNKMIAYQEANDHSQRGGDSTDFWGKSEALQKLVDRLKKRKRLSEEEYQIITFMISSRYLMLDLKVALLAYKRAETLLPLKRLLGRVAPEVEKRKNLRNHFWTLSSSEISRCLSLSDTLFSEGHISYTDKLLIQEMLKTRQHITELKAAFSQIQKTHNGSDQVALLKSVLSSLKMTQEVPTISRHRSNDMTPSLSPDFHDESQRIDTLSLSTGFKNNSITLETKIVSKRDGNAIALPILTHASQTKEQYLALRKAADLFYNPSTSSNSSKVRFDDEVLQKLLHVVDMLQK